MKVGVVGTEVLRLTDGERRVDALLEGALVMIVKGFQVDWLMEFF